MAPDLIIASEAARKKGVTRQSIYAAIDSGKLNEVRQGKTRLVVKDEKWETYEPTGTGGRPPKDRANNEQ